MNKRILILSEAFGAGHTKAAEAIKEGIRIYQPTWQVEMIELGTWLRPTLSHWISEIYLKTIKYSPKLWGVLYKKVQNRTVKPHFELLLHFIYAKVMQLVREKQPDLIIATHPFPSAVISRLKRMGIKIPLHVVITDYGAHGTWINEGVDYYYLSSFEMKEYFIRLGVPNERIFVTGLPTHPMFWKREEQSFIREKLGLANKPTILFMGGGLGIGLDRGILDTLSDYRDKFQFLIVTGKNTKLYHQLQLHPLSHHPNIRIYPFVENVDELMDASDFIVTKPGGMTTAEAIAKSIPMILFNPIPGHEQENLDFIQQRKLGIAIMMYMN
ncbi:MGDG synthase family glycosyltransferase [Tepidibacillus fermentans]|uniref:Processive 1,2-diacylglycerol beta-glucosyltransferase n=1 Tax=Tepidibacillus fermentans TaxID=1281767 RepID=A0A4R3KDM6_9BACI|nr:glycosyltransferase [Tepidibacillus fermentans]TCS81258.1 processive 1,2-diacylglycerol beta-glucosyltransferase [Tepidibacillus fermentans]